ncbi:MAG: hypothetical protein C5B50_13815 [Verrucomicrobia bacterium]|nr:MAG: hypothetical protein C5B50_13815 [Verrucomicrobiota bacterium]
MKNSRSRKLEDFIFVDESMIHRLSEQIRDGFAEVDRKSWKMSASLTGPVLETSRTTERVPLKLHEKIELIEIFLDVKKDLYSGRPATLPIAGHAKTGENGAHRRFIIESTEATKVIIPITGMTPIKGLASACIWIADPDPTVYVREPWDWRGTFLYLSELRWDNGPAGQFLSGVSALQAIVNLTHGLDFFHIITDEYEPFGRGSDLHPVDKLKKIGGIVVDKRKVRSLYRIRYFANEQTYRHEGEERRVNDLLGYPLYIASEA